MIGLSSKSGGVNLKAIHEALTNQDFQALKDLQDELVIANGVSNLDKVCHFDANIQNLKKNKSHQTVVATGSMIGLYDPSPRIIDLLSLNEELEQILVPKKNNIFAIFALDKKGVLNVICSQSMMTIFQWDQVKHDYL